MDADQLLHDPVLNDLTDRVSRQVPFCRSLVVIGSRASPAISTAYAPHDYDVVAVIPTLRVPFALSSLKRIESEVSGLHNVRLSLNPLATLRLRFCDGNYMLLKLGAEGVVILGKDILPQARRVSPASIGQWWYFFFLASQAKRLLGAVPFQQETDATEGGQASAPYHAAKAIMGCAELMALRSGLYTSDPALLYDKLIELGRSELAARVRAARGILQDADSSANASALWHEARAALLATLGFFAQEYLNIPHTDRARFAGAFLRTGGPWSPVRDLQYTTLALLGGRSFHPRALLDRRGVAERAKLALFLLLEACGPDQTPDASLVASARRCLFGAIALPPRGEGWAEWQSVLRAVSLHYPHACVALGF